MPSDSKETAKKEASKTVATDETGLRLDRWFKRHFSGVPHGQLQKWLRTGQIRVDGKRADSSDRLSEGQTVRLPPPLWQGRTFAAPARDGAKPLRHPEKLKKLILYEDEDVVALNKPAGLAVQGGTGLKENLDDSLMALSLDGVTRPKLVHRLDRETSGVLLVARNDFAAMKLTAAFRERATQKIYWAITHGVPKPESGRIDAPLVKSGQLMRVVLHGEKREDIPRLRKEGRGAERRGRTGETTGVSAEREEIKKASTLYKVVESVPKKMAFVALWPLTGRTHQLRVHLQHLGTPIWGDPLYGGAADDAFPPDTLGTGLHLHARRLIIPHPRRGFIDVTAPLGPQMRKTWRWLHFDAEADVDFEDV